jgi:hypothetical protein
MALGNGGLDAQVEQRMDAYRSNPQQLQQRYGQNKELLDLLALQKLTSEKQAAARDMQMKMQQQPGTIAQQREQEALELTKQEMSGTLGELAGRTKGTLDQKQAMQQQNMQKMAQGQPPVAQGGIGALMGGQQARPPMQGVPPQAQGLANARMQAPVQMAKGGIVSFAGADGNNEVVGAGTPFSRFMEPLLTKKGSRLLTPEMQALRKRVRKKFETYGGIPAGLFTQQTPEMQEYASKVLSNINLLSEEELLRLEQTEFDPMTSDVSGLPAISTTPAAAPNLTPTVTSASAAPPAASAASAADNTTGSVTLEQSDPYETAMARLPEEVFNIPVVVPEAADRTKVDAAQQALLDTVGEVPEAYTPTKTEFAELAPVSPESSLDEQGMEARRFLLQRGADLAGADVNSSVDAARASADEYGLRAAKQETARQQLAREQAYQARVLDPKRVKRLKRLESMAGGAKYGTGGIGQGRLDAENRYDTLEAKGLANLVALEQAAMNNDYNLVAQGMGAGENAATRAQADRIRGENIASGEVTNQQNLAVGQQTARQGVNTANTAALNASELAAYQAKITAISNEAAARRQILSSETSNVTDQTKRLVDSSTNEQNQLIANSRAAIERAKNEDSFAIELQKIRSLDRREATIEHSTLLRELEQEKNIILDSDLNYQALLAKVAKAKGASAEAEATRKVTMYADTLEAILAGRFARSYAKLDELKLHIETLQRQDISSRPPLTGQLDANSENVTVTPINP